MSRLIEMLDKTHESSRGLGFAASRQAATPSVVLIGRVTAQELADTEALAESDVDALLVTLDAADAGTVARISGLLGDRLWGARVGSVSAEDAQALKDAGCDFIVFDAEDTAAAVLNNADVGKIIAIDSEDPEFDENTAKAVRTLDIDGALFASAESLLPLTVQKLLGIQATRALVGRRTILTAPAGLGKTDIEALRNAGVVGLAVSLAGADDVARMKADIAGLPRRQSQRSGATAKAPNSGFLRSQQSYDD